MKIHKTLLAMLLALALAASACSSDDGDETTDDVSTEESTEEVVEESTEADEPVEESAEESAEETAEDAAAEGTIAVELNEWDLVMPDTVPTGPVTYVVSNTGEFGHRLAVARGTSYEELPQLENGAVDIEALGDDFLGEQEANLETGDVGEITWDLPAGDYVFFCPVAFGPNSHARAGQVRSVTVG